MSDDPSGDRRAVAARALPLLDLTSLGDDDQPADIDRLCADAVTGYGPVASVCVWPRFVAQAASILDGSGVRICAVANFPEGDDDDARAIADAAAIVADGGDEVDVVVPWRRVADGDAAPVERLVGAVRVEIGPSITLKAILETGELPDDGAIADTARAALAGGADFLKTSTGKTAHSATPGAAAVLAAVLAVSGTSATGPGIKISGGVGSVEDAERYLAIVDEAFGRDWVGPATFRFGASRLLGELLRTLDLG